ncbi:MULTISPECIES: hypothetical protein [unclassified Mesorhizobium]|uniref:hypothetical protein n=1 Tax=unclassified Mesorhizobium TaxID=325217 RepID=UPI0019D21207|nr:MULTISPECIES: hypothetical protein [unclassified Mesorhizobium]
MSSKLTICGTGLLKAHNGRKFQTPALAFRIGKGDGLELELTANLLVVSDHADEPFAIRFDDLNARLNGGAAGFELFVVFALGMGHAFLLIWREHQRPIERRSGHLNLMDL